MKYDNSKSYLRQDLEELGLIVASKIVDKLADGFFLVHDNYYKIKTRLIK